MKRLRELLRKPFVRLLGVPVGVLLGGVLLATLLLPLVPAEPTPAAARAAAAPGAPHPASLTEVLTRARTGGISTATLDPASGTLTVAYAPTGDDRAAAAGHASTTVPASYQHDTLAALIAAGVPVRVTNPVEPTRATPAPSLVQRLVPFLPLVLLIPMVLAGVSARRDRGAATAAAGATGSGTDVPTTRFADVAGCDEAVAELTELVDFLRTPQRFTRTGATAPKGALLVGPPGTGKTLLARAVAGEAGVPFFAVAGSDFVEMYVGLGAKRVRQLFAKAGKHEKAIIFIDEVDAVARRRSGGADASGGAVEGENTLNALLTEMDGFTGSHVIVLAATNRPDALDEAITRPGRLDRKVEVPNPDRRGREQILAVHTAGKPIAAGVDLTALARRTPGFSGAQLKALVNEACTDAARRDLDQVSADCFDHAVATIAMGRARTSALVTEHDRQVTAWHEAGHTLAAYLQDDADDPVQVTIVPRGPAGGVTWMSGNDDQFLSRRKAHAQLVTALAGRAGEELLLDGEYTQGASGDLTSATNLARAMATQYGMTRLGYQVRDPRGASAEVTEVVEELLAAAHTAAADLLGAHRDFLAALAGALLEEETLTLADVDTLARAHGVARHARVPVPPLPAPSPVAAPAPAPVRGRVPVPRRPRPLAVAATARRARVAGTGKLGA